MIYQEVIFTKEECEKIISYKEVYTDLIWRSLEPAIDFENRRKKMLDTMKISGDSDTVKKKNSKCN